MEKVKTNALKGNVGHTTYCKNIITAFINGEFCSKSDYQKTKYELNAARDNLGILQTEIRNKNSELQKYKAAQENQTYKHLDKSGDIPKTNTNKNSERSLPSLLYALWQNIK